MARDKNKDAQRRRIERLVESEDGLKASFGQPEEDIRLTETADSAPRPKDGPPDRPEDSESRLRE